jgi:predicted transposase YdaD
VKENPDNKPEKGNVYDKIFKENAELIFMPLIAQRLDIQIQSFKRLPHKMQTTIEKELDFFYEILTLEGEIRNLHIEFQVVYDAELVYRFSEYHGLGLRRKKRPTDHFLVYLGSDNPAFQTQLPEAEVFRGYQVINLHELDTNSLLSSQTPEQIILAILSNYSSERIEAVLRLIVSKLKEITSSSGSLDKYLQQLLILSRLRKIEAITNKIIEEMSLLVDIEKDTFYIKGIEKGIEKGKLEGKLEGIEEGSQLAQRKMIINLISKLGLDDRSIAELTEVPLKVIRKIRKEMQK